MGSRPIPFRSDLQLRIRCGDRGRCRSDLPVLQHDSQASNEVQNDRFVYHQLSCALIVCVCRYSLLTSVQVFPRDKFEYARQAMLHVYMALKGHERCADLHPEQILPPCSVIVGGSH